MDKQAFFAAHQPRTHVVNVPDAGGDFSFQEFSGETRDAVLSAARAEGSTSDYEIALIVASVVDEKGNLVFTQDDAAQLRTLSARALTGLALAAMQVNKIGKPAEDAAAKN